MCILQIHAGKAKYPFYSDLGSSEAPATLLLIACYITIETNDPAQTLLMVLSFFSFCSSYQWVSMLCNSRSPPEFAPKMQNACLLCNG